MSTIASVLAGERAWHVACADWRAFATEIPDGAVNLLWLDGPYGMGKADWDRFDSPAAMLAFYDGVLDEARRVLAPNGSLYVCASTEAGAALETLVRSKYSVLNSITWTKATDGTMAAKYGEERLRSFVPKSERIIFAEHSPAAAVAYLRAQCAAAGMTPEDLSAFCGFKPTGGSVGPRRYLSVDGFAPIARQDYERLQRATEYFDRPYDKLYRPFFLTDAAPIADAWEYPSVPAYPGRHLAEKPPAMLRDVIAASSREGDLVCEWFTGSGVGGEQAVLQGRRYLGCDIDPEWARRATARIERAEREPHRSGKPMRPEKQQPAQTALLLVAIPGSAGGAG